jgi:hypothetical protein
MDDVPKTIVDALQRKYCMMRVSTGNRWMYWGSERGGWIVVEWKPGRAGGDELYCGPDEERAIGALWRGR